MKIRSKEVSKIAAIRHTELIYLLCWFIFHFINRKRFPLLGIPPSLAPRYDECIWNNHLGNTVIQPPLGINFLPPLKSSASRDGWWVHLRFPAADMKYLKKCFIELGGGVGNSGLLFDPSLNPVFNILYDSTV